MHVLLVHPIGDLLAYRAVDHSEGMWAVAKQVRQLENTQQRIIDRKEADRYHCNFQSTRPQRFDEIPLRTELPGRVDLDFNLSLALSFKYVLELPSADVFRM